MALPGPVVRTATPDDAPAIVSLVESAYRGESSRAGWTTEADLLGGQRTDLAEVTAVLASPACQMLLAVDDDGTLVGCCEVERRADSAYFGMFAVSPPMQGRGIGDMLLARAEELAREEWAAPRMEMLVISVRTELIRWYERRGYQLTGRTEPFPYGDERFGVPLRDDLEFVVLEKDLKPARIPD